VYYCAMSITTVPFF
nr:immunoglobulin heavy chain junction region [Mus musculus]